VSDRLTAAVVIPCLNEQEAIGPCIREVRAAIRGQDLPVEIRRVIVVDNGSSDDTARTAREAGADVILESRRGYGRACLTGVEAADGVDLIILMDGDGSDHFEEVGRLLEPICAGAADLVIGSRIQGTHAAGSLTSQQLLGNKLATALFFLMYRVRLTDIGPFRVIRRDRLLGLGMREMTYGWSIEMIARAIRTGMRVQEVPVSYRNRIGGESKVSGNFRTAVRAGVRILGAILRTRWTPDAERS
jgi:glycosyltransferase involved in cell wall biosynthesis